MMQLDRPVDSAPDTPVGDAAPTSGWRSTRVLWLLPLVLSGLWVPLTIAVGTPGRQGASVVGNAAMVLAAWIGLARHRPPAGRPWILLLWGNAFAAVGSLLQLLADARLDAAPLATAAGLCYGATYVLITTGYLKMLRARTGRRDPGARQVDAAIFTLAGMLVVWTFLVQPLLGTVPAGSSEWWLLIAIPAGNLFIAFLLFRLLLLPSAGNTSMRLVAGAMALVVLTDLARLVLTGTGADPTTASIGYVGSLGLWAAAMLHPHITWAAQPTPMDDGPRPVRFGLLAIAGATAPLVYAVKRLTGDAGGSEGLVLLTFVMFTLFLVRLRLTVTALDRLRGHLLTVAEREQVLARAAAALLGADHRSQVHRLCQAAAAAISGECTVELRSAPGPQAGWSLPIPDPADPQACLWLDAVPADDQVRRALTALVTATGMRLQALHTADLLAANEVRFRSVVQHAADGIMIVDRDGRITYASPSADRLLGRPLTQVDGASALDLLDEGPRRDAGRQLLARTLGSPREPLSDQFQVSHPDGRTRTFQVTVTNLLDIPGVDGLVANFRDVTQQRSLEETLLHRAETDDLTGLGNRAALRARIDALLPRARHEPFAVVLFDLDDFKTVNDTMGHDAGDRLLVALARRLQHNLRGQDLACRLGGDEFAVVCRVDDPDDAGDVATRLLQAMASPVVLDGRSLRTTVSAGLVLSTDAEPSMESLLTSADLALYAAKAAGKDDWQRYRTGMREDAVARQRLRTDLVQALADGDIICHYQPVVMLGTEHIVGAEALVRWRLPDGGLRSPASFLPLAEETGLIVPVGVAVLRQACLDAVRWTADDPEFTLNVNVSARQLERPEFAAEVRAILAETGLAPTRLLLEVTETAIMEKLDVCLDALNALREQGIRVAIDDFGTGYSSLAHLRRLPVDVLKIDMSFVAEVDRGPEDSALAKAIVRLAATLSLHTIAEGIERPSQAKALQELGCTLAQGYLFARPVPADELTQMLAVQAVTC